MTHTSQTLGLEARIPSMRFAVTERCNLKCHYCPTAGDSYAIKGARLSAEQFSHTAVLAHQAGFRHFSITGGEPLSAPETTFSLAKTISTLPDIGYLRLNTNGVLVPQFIDDIITSNFEKVKVSLDSLSQGKTEDPALRTGQLHVVDPVIEGIALMRARRVPVRLNAVIGKNNIHEVDSLVTFCEEQKIELKLFDITFYRNALSTTEDYWEQTYVGLKELHELFKQRYGAPTIVHAVGGYGNPMPIFKADSQSPIRLRMSDGAAFYRDDCKNCLDYLCQDGFCNVTITADGGIKPCRPEGLPYVAPIVDTNGELLNDTDILRSFQRVIELFQGTKLYERNMQEMKHSWAEESS